MKRFKVFLAALIAVIMAVCAAACIDDGENGKVDINIGDKNAPTYTFVTDGELTESTVSKQDTVNKLQATDDYGRSLGYINGEKTDKERYVGLFYFTWLGWHGGEMNGVYDVSKLIDENPNALWNTAGTKDSPIGKYHHWGEPLYGYYNSKDPWVIRKHMELFILSGVDFIAFDCTNGFDYIDVVAEMLPIMEEMRVEGWDVPKFMFYLNSRSSAVIDKLYYGNKEDPNATTLVKEGIYKAGNYKELWFAPAGKPKIAAITDPNSTNGEGGLPAAEHVVKDTEILGFFDFWESQWPNNTIYENGLPWMDWQRPQRTYTDTINVGVAQHNSLPFSDALLSADLADKMWGRGYNNDSADHSDEAIESAKNFNEQWEVAIQRDLKYTFVTGWNEWVAIKSAANLSHNSSYPECVGNRVYFVDTVNKEYSRDIEMMKDGYADNVFLSLMRNTRTYKGKEGTMPAAAGTAAGFDITTGMSKWNSVSNVYYDITGIKNRDFKGFAPTVSYKDDSIVNDISEIRVTHDANNLYFLVRCEDDIVISPEKNNWMNLMIDVEGQSSNSWYGYDYVINRLSSYTGECGVEKYNYAKGKLTFDLTAKANFTVNGKFMQYKVSKKSLGITGDNFTINFKVADNVTDPDDMQSYYITGDVAPVGRINYTYKGSK